MEITPYKFNVSSLVIFDRATQYNPEMAPSLSDVLAENGKHYNVWNPLFLGEGVNKEVKGVVRNHVKALFQRVGSNFYNKAHTVVLNNEKLPKNTQALAGLLNPLIAEAQNIFPFKPDFVLSTQQIQIVVETAQGTEERPVKEEKKNGDAVFSDFLSVSGWCTTSAPTMENVVMSINLTSCVKFLATNIVHNKVLSDIGTMQKLIEEHCSGMAHIGVLFNTNTMTQEDHEMMAQLLAAGYRVVTPNTSANAYWLPPTKTALEEKVMRSLGNQAADILLVK